MQCVCPVFYIIICDLSGLSYLYHHLWHVWPIIFISSPVTCLAYHTYIIICDLSGLSYLYHHLWPVWPIIFLSRCHKQNDFRGKKNLNINCLFWFSVYRWNVSHYNNNWARCDKKVYCLHVKWTKIRIFNARVKSVLLYGCETWLITKEIQHKIQTLWIDV
jgi:hypothetical protein